MEGKSFGREKEVESLNNDEWKQAFPNEFQYIQ